MTTTHENDPKQIMEREVSPIVHYAEALQIRNHDDFAAANDTLKEIKRRDAKIDEIFDPIRTAQHAAWKLTCDTISFLKNPLKNAENVIKQKCTSWSIEQERIRQEEARAAEAKRQEEERKRQAELERQAQAAEAKGKTEKAEALREAKDNYVAPPVFTPPPPPAVKGASFRKTWVGECIDLKALCQSIADGKAPLNLVVPNQSAINAFAKGVKNTMPIPGLRFEERTDMSVRK